eukprot:TRINITY_DN17389_c1_g2_i2.p1 TRINITY_DN17389_c1_g2~~TRINITY_DN17389_c1_g2_i2.p1  ORF type:complete len:805 (-),score=118.37 TRINITY_DN17389_c1_g2_i2:154-2568(-)
MVVIHTAHPVELKEILDLIHVLLPNEVGLCLKLLEALKGEHEGIGDAHVGVQHDRVAKCMGHFLDRSAQQQPEDSVGEGLGLLEDSIRSCSFWHQVRKHRGSMASSLYSLDQKLANNRHDGGAIAFLDKNGRKTAKFQEIGWWPQVDCVKAKLFLAMDSADSCRMGKLFALLMMVTLAVSTLCLVLESSPENTERPAECEQLRLAGKPLTIEACQPKPLEIFKTIEVACILGFTLEYLGRVALVHSVHPESALTATLSYIEQPMNLLDLVAVVPFYVEVTLASVSIGSGFLSIFKLVRVLRLFKAAKHNPAIVMFGDVLVTSGQPLMILFFFVVIMSIMFGALIYYAEGQTYSVAPVGYGDYSPTTHLGKLTGVLCFYVGIIFLALPVSVLGSNFETLYEAMMEKRASQGGHKETRGKKRLITEVKHSKPMLPDGDSVRKKLFLLFDNPQASWLAHRISIFMMLVILFSTGTFIIESMPEVNDTPEACLKESPRTVENCRPAPRPVFHVFETITTLIFTIDYVVRLSTVHVVSHEDCESLPEPTAPGRQATLAYFVNWMNIVDLLAILPFYISFLAAGEDGPSNSGGGGVLRVLRLIRIFRIMKMPKLRACVDMFVNVIRDALPALGILFLMTGLMGVILSTCIFYAEGTTYSVDYFKEDYPYGTYIRPSTDGHGVEVSPYTSIIYSFWWFFATATTVGYGDDYPTTTAGRIVAIATFYTGIVLLALPVTIVSGSFSKFYPDFIAEFGMLSGHGDDEVHHESEAGGPISSCVGAIARRICPVGSTKAKQAQTVPPLAPKVMDTE